MSLDQSVLQAKRYGVIDCDPQRTLFEAAQRMIAEDISGLVVVDQEGRLAGVISRIDLLRACLQHKDWQSLPVSRFMSAQVVTVTPQTTLKEVARLLLDKHIHRVVVVRREGQAHYPLSVISSADILYHMLKENGQES